MSQNVSIENESAVLSSADSFDKKDGDESNAEKQIPLDPDKLKTLVGPWRNVEEFHKVYDWLFADFANNETKHLAKRQMIIWKVRRSIYTPAAVLATLALLEIQLKDSDNMENTYSQRDLQILYSSAFTRFYNYMSSIVQTHNLKTMYETAKELGIHSFVVDLRHLCAHGQTLPPLDLLRKVSDYCLGWVKDYYWTRQNQSMCNVDARHTRRKDITQFEDNVTKLFQIYDSTLECHLKGAHNIKTAKRHLHGKRFVALKEYYESKTAVSLTVILGALTKDLIALVKRERAIRDAESIYIEAFLNMNYFFKVAELHTGTEDELTKVIAATQGLFRMLSVNGFIEDLFHSLLPIVENVNEEEERRKGVGFWAHELVKGFVAFKKCKDIYKEELDENPNLEFDLTTLNFDNTTKSIKKLFKNAGIDMRKTLIFGDTIRRPWIFTVTRSYVEERFKLVNEYSADVLRNIIDVIDPRISEEEAKTLRQLLDIQFGTPIAVDSQLEIDRVYTVDDLPAEAGIEKMITDSDVSETKDGVKKYGIWSTVPDCQDWSSFPLGKLIWQ